MKPALRWLLLAGGLLLAAALLFWALREISLAQLAAVALAMLLLGLLWSSRAAMLNEFDHTLNRDLPNRFVINIAEADRAGLQLWLRDHGVAHSTLYPVVRGRLLRIAGEVVAQAEGSLGVLASIAN